MTVIAGVGMKTVFKTQFERKFFKDRLTIETSRRAEDPDRDGDGRVPLRSAELEYVDAIHYVRGKHGGLPNVKAVYEDVFRKLTGETLSLPTTPAAALAAHLGDDETDMTPALTDPTLATADPEDPGYLDFDDPDEAIVDELDQRLADGLLPEFTLNRVRPRSRTLSWQEEAAEAERQGDLYRAADLFDRHGQPRHAQVGLHEPAGSAPCAGRSSTGC